MFPLRVRSYYSLMQGHMSPADICRRAARFGHKGVALTDRDNLYGLWSFLAACKKEGLHPIIGAEISEPEGDRLATCLVRTERGYTNLCNIISKRHLDGEFQLEEALFSHGDGLLILLQDHALLEELRLKGMDPVADLGPYPTARAEGLKRWAAANHIRAVATHACSIADEKDREVYLLLRAIDQNKSISEISEGERVVHCFAHPRVYQERFAIWPEVIEESYRLAQQCEFRGPSFGLVMPPWRGADAGETLRNWAYMGARSRYGDDLSETVVERLEHELSTIESMGFSSYFLVVRNIVHRLQEDGSRRKRRICGRGSGAASLVAYCLEITNVCPIKYNLYFERFLNPGRSDPPDIDIDFAWDERDEVLAEVLQKHGRHAALVCNHTFFKPRMAIRETAKVYGIPGYEISRITKKLPWMYAKSKDLFQQIEKVPALCRENLDAPWPDLINLAGRLIGIPRHLSVHPGGVVITPRPVSDYVPVEMAPKGVPIIQWEKDGTEEAGLVKIDLLGNRSLAVIRDCLDSVHGRGVVLDENNWEPEEDILTKEAVSKGRTMGCFYIESPAMRLLQKKGGTGEYEQLVIQSSIIRPAANDFVREYVRRLHGGEWQPLHPKLGDVLDETFGLMVYQEDVSRVAVHLAGFSHAMADGLRKVMSKKDKEQRLADYKKKFYKGCRSNDIEGDSIDSMWSMMMSFDGYSFCKPHSASYARVSFQAAYLKTYFPAEFMAAVISNQGGYYSAFAYVSEAKRLGVKVNHPDINLSTIRWQGEKGEIRVGLQSVNGLSQNLMERLLRERERNGAFRNGTDFFQRTHPAEDEARQLIHAGALDSLEKEANRTVLLWELASYRRIQDSGRSISLFPIELPSPPPLKPPPPVDMLRREYEALGFLCKTHPIVLYAKKTYSRVDSRHLVKHVGRRVRFLGWLLTGKLVSTKTGEAMEFLTFEDELGLVETTFFPRVYHRYAHLLQSGKPYLLQGLVESDFGVITLTVESLSIPGQ